MHRFSRVLLGMFLAAVFLFTFNQLKESDSFYHLKVGQVIWETQAVPQKDIFSLTAEGAPWITHEWLAELLFFAAYKLGGFGGLAGFVALLAVLTYYLVFLTAIRGRANAYVTFAAAIVLATLTFELWVPRPQVFAFLCFALLLFLLEEFRREPKPKFLLCIVAVLWFWANVHASVILGLVLLLLYVLVESLKLQWPTLGRSLPRREIRRLALGAGAALLATFLNPNSYEIFLYRSAVEPAIRALGILEWKSILYFLPQREALLFVVLMVVSLGIVFWGRWSGRESSGREKGDATAVVAVSAVFLLPMLSIRHVGFWPLIAIPAVAQVLSEKGETLLRHLNPKGVKWGVGAGLLVLLGFSVVRVPQTFVRRDTLPVGAADFIVAHELQGPILNLYNEGGYLIWRLWPREKVFIDGRSEIFSEETIADLFRIVGRTRGWDDLLFDKYRINMAILPYRPSSLARDTVPLSFALEERGFHLVYWDDAAMLLVRENLLNRQFLEQFGLRLVHPFRDPRSIPEEERKAAGEEIQSLLSRAPQSPAVQEYAKQFLADH